MGLRRSALAERIGRPATAGAGADAVVAGYERLTALCESVLLGVYQRMGALLRPGERHTVSGLADRLGIVPKYHRLHSALLNILADAGHLTVRGDEVEVASTPDESDPHRWDGEFDRIAADHPDIAATVTLTRLFLRSYPEVLRGEVVATEIMFPGGSMELVQDFYRGNPLTDSFNELVARAVAEHARAALPALGAGQRLRLVEFGAGTGATTDRVLPVLSAHADRVEYVFTDISPEFLDSAERRFGARYPFTRFRTLNLELSLAGQGFEPGSADVVVATNVVHATSDLRATLRKARELLRPGGWLVLNELTVIRAGITVTGGVLDGWWAFADGELRIKDAPLAHAGTWQRLLVEEGFTDTLVLDRGPRLGQHVIIGENAARPAPATAPAVSAAAAAAVRPESANATVADPDTAAAPLLPRLAAIFEAALKLDQPLDPDRPLSEYGFDSLSGTRIAGVIEEDLGVRVRLGDLLQHPTLRGLTDHLAEKGVNGAGPAAAPPAPEESAHRQEPVSFPLSVGQRALSVIERTAPGNYAYNLPLAFWLDPDVDVAALRAALRSMVDRHPQLRARVVGERQVVDPGRELAFTERRLDTSSTGDMDAVREAARACLREPFDLAAGPLLRATLFGLADGRHVLLLTFHHIVFDGVSIPVFLRELSAFYRQSPPTGAPKVTFADFVREQQDLLASERGERLRAYWLRQLAGELPALRLPLDRPRPVVPSYRGPPSKAAWRRARSRRPGGWPTTRAPRCSVCCSPPTSRCCTATPPGTGSWSARPSPGARRPNTPMCSATS
ncbi:condensation domain-containing protein [Streptomyces sp. FXJ1.4098]|nr:condensation domain-containing protein [Streptomyces sp. FXJ1.4098]